MEHRLVRLARGAVHATLVLAVVATSLPAAGGNWGARHGPAAAGAGLVRVLVRPIPGARLLGPLRRLLTGRTITGASPDAARPRLRAAGRPLERAAGRSVYKT